MKKLLLILLLFVGQNLSSQEIATGTNGDVYSSVAAPFKPSDLSGLELWLDAANVVKDGSNNISSWIDASGNNHDAVQGVLASQPLYVASGLNSKPTVRFDGGNDNLTSTFNNDAPNTVFIVYKVNGAATTGNQILFDNHNGSSSRNLGYVIMPILCATYSNGSQYTYNSQFPFTKVATWKYDGANSSMYENSTHKWNGVQYNNTSNAISIGTNYLANNNFFNGDIAEILIYSGSLSDVNREFVETYLINKYNPLSHTNTIPLMTSNTTPSGIVSASSELGTPYAAWYSMNHTYAENYGWVSNNTQSGYLQYQFAASKIVKSYLVNPNIYPNSAPKDWTFEGSNDGSNFTVLDTQTNQVFDYGSRGYSFTNTNSYLYYRINISANNGRSYVAIKEFEMYEDSSFYNPISTTEYILTTPPPQ